MIALSSFFTRKRALSLATGCVVLAGGVLSIADTIAPLKAINPTVAHYWPQVLIGAMCLKQFGSYILSKLETKKALAATTEDQPANPTP